MVSECWICHASGSVKIILGDGYIVIKCVECKQSVTIEGHRDE